MGFFNLFSGRQIPDSINAASNLYTTDKARINAETDFQNVVEQPGLMQLENNKVMALSNHFFNNSWQSLTGWTAGFCVALFYVPQIIICLWVWGHKVLLTGIITPFPMKPDDILNLVYLLFGFGFHSIVNRKLSN